VRPLTRRVYVITSAPPSPADRVRAVAGAVGGAVVWGAAAAALAAGAVAALVAAVLGVPAPGWWVDRWCEEHDRRAGRERPAGPEPEPGPGPRKRRT
jgi:outer membrane lipoprotein SlyB